MTEAEVRAALRRAAILHRLERRLLADWKPIRLTITIR